MYPFYESIQLHVPGRIARDDATRQERTAREILRRLAERPGLILADEVGMGKTFVALAVAVSTALANRGRRPVVVMTPPALRQKWPADFALFTEKCIDAAAGKQVTCGTADRAEEFLKLLDDPPQRRKSVIFVSHGAMSRGLQDPWVKAALIYRALRHRKDGNRIRRALCRNEAMPQLLHSRIMYRVTEEAWAKLLVTPTAGWLEVLQRFGIDPEGDDNPGTDDDPVPKAIRQVLSEVDTDGLYAALQHVPINPSENFKSRIQKARTALNEQLRHAWRECLARVKIKLPLLILDEAHHLKNADTRLASLFRSPDAAADADELAGKGALNGVFERMLFLTATPFQLGHHELCSVLERFEGIRWKGSTEPAGGRDQFREQLADLRSALDTAQEAAVSLDHAWGRLKSTDLVAGSQLFTSADGWWTAASQPGVELSPTAVGVMESFARCREKLGQAQEKLQPWVIRHLKQRHLPDTKDLVLRRHRLPGRAITDDSLALGEAGLKVEGEALLPFLLAARATACAPESRPVFAEGLASSFEAFLETRLANRKDAAAASESLLDGDDDHESTDRPAHSVVANWYLDELETTLRGKNATSPPHPKIAATVRRTVEAWSRGEKVLVFCHYVRTGQIIRQRISEALHDEILRLAIEKLHCNRAEAEEELERIGTRFFDEDSPARRQCDAEAGRIVDAFPSLQNDRQAWLDIVRRNVRTPSLLVRFFSLGSERFGADEVSAAFTQTDHSGLTLQGVLERFFRFLEERCGEQDRANYLSALQRVQTGSHTGQDMSQSFDSDELVGHERTERLLPNVRLVNGRSRPETRQRLMLTFNTPFYPEVLIASSVMAEGVDLHRNCRYVIHHDLCWNPSTLEQRTGRVDRIGAKAEICGFPIHVYLPYIAATQDEKMYRVVMDRERWFSVVMGENYKVDAHTTEKLAERVPLPEAAAIELAFRLEVARTERASAVENHPDLKKNST